MSDSLGEAVLTLKTDSSPLDAGMLSARDSVSGLTDAMTGLFGSSMGGAISGVVSLLTGPAGLVAAVGALGAAALSVGLEFDDAFDRIRVNTGATGPELAKLQDSFKNVFTSVPSDAEAVSTALAGISSRLGLTGADLEALTTQMLNLSRITGTDLSQNVTAVTRVFGDWSIATDRQGEAADFLFKVSQSTGSSVSQLGERIVQFGAPLRQMGFDFETSAAMLGKFEKEGVNTELVLGSMRIALTRMAKEGVTDAAAAFEEVIGKIKAAGSAGEANALALETFGARAGPDMAAAIREGRLELTDFIAQLKTSSDTINKAAADTADFAEEWKILKNNVTAILEPIGTFLISALNSLASAASGVVKEFRDIVELSGAKFMEKTSLDRVADLDAKLKALGISVDGTGLSYEAWANELGRVDTALKDQITMLPQFDSVIVRSGKNLEDYVVQLAKVEPVTTPLTEAQSKLKQEFKDSLAPMESLKKQLDELISFGFSRTDVVMKYSDEIIKAAAAQQALGRELSPGAKLLLDLANAHEQVGVKVASTTDLVGSLSTAIRYDTAVIGDNFIATAQGFRDASAILDNAIEDMAEYQAQNRESSEAVMEDFSGILAGIASTDEGFSQFADDWDVESKQINSLTGQMREVWGGWVDDLKNGPIVTTMEGVTSGIKKSLGDMASSAKDSLVNMFKEGDFSGSSFKNMLVDMTAAFNPLQIGMNLVTSGVSALGKAIGGWITGPDSWEMVQKEMSKNYGITAGTDAIKKFAESVGLSESKLWSMRAAFEASPVFLASFAAPLAETQGSMEKFLKSLESVSSTTRSWYDEWSKKPVGPTYDFRDAFELGNLTGDWTELNKQFTAVFGNVKGFSESLLMQNTVVKDVGAAMNYYWGQLQKTGEVSDSLTNFAAKYHDQMVKIAATTKDAHQADLLLLTDLNAYYDEMTQTNVVSPAFIKYISEHSDAITALAGKYPTLTGEVNKANAAMVGTTMISGLNVLRDEFSGLKNMIDALLPPVKTWQEEFVKSGVITDALTAKVKEAGGNLDQFKQFADMKQTELSFEALVEEFNKTGVASDELIDIMAKYGVIGTGVTDTVVESLDDVTDAFSTTGGATTKVTEGLQNVADKGSWATKLTKDSFNDLADTVRGNMKTSLTDAASGVSTELSKMDNLLVQSIKAMTDAIVAAINGLATTIKAPLTQVQDAIDKIAQPVTVPIDVVTTYTTTGVTDGGGVEATVAAMAAAGVTGQQIYGYLVSLYGNNMTWEQFQAMYGYAEGTDYVPRTGPYYLHEGEAVVTAAENRARLNGDFAINYTDNSVFTISTPPGGSQKELFVELERIIETNRGNIRRILQDAARASI